MQVELLYHTPDPERAIATAARLCYAPVGAAELMEAMPEERVKSVLSTIMSAGCRKQKRVCISDILCSHILKKNKHYSRPEQQKHS